MEQIKWVWSLMNRKSHRWHIFALILCVITNMTILVNPTLTARIVDDVIVAQNPDPLPMLLFCIMGFAVVHSCMRYVMAILMEYTSQQMLYTLRQRLFAKLQHQDMHFFDVHRTGDLMTRMSSDMDWVRHFVAGTDYMLTDCIVGFLTTMTYFFFVSWKLALALVCIMPLLMIICVVYSKSIAPLFATMRDRHADMNTQAQENIAANRVVKAFAREEYEKASFDEKSKAFREAQLNINKRWLTFYPAIDILANLASMVTIFLGAVFLIQGEITAGQLSIFINLTWAISNPMRLIGNYLDQVQQFLTRAKKVMELDLARPDIVDGDQAVSHGRMKGKIEFRHVSFAYNTQTVLEDVDFTVEPGQTLAIMGPTGSGKTTMIHLLAHFYNPKQGQILVDDCDVRKWKLQELRGGIGTATQDVFLFSDTVEGNIAFGNQELTEDEVKDFAYRAAAGDFIPKLSEGYDTIIGERGVGLSGGQKQRIALARALAVKPSILIMDDTTSAVDMETEQFIQKQLRELPYDCTKIIIAQRISSVKDADLILVLKNGRIAERGKHEDLLRNRGYYYETFCLQNGIDPEKEAV